jgi:von Willebrand factor type A domain
MRSMGRRALVLIGIFAGGAVVAAGCASTAQSGDLQVKMLAASSDTPSNVALNVSVGNKSGEPIVGLKPANFRIFEDGKLVPEDKAKRMLLDPKMAEVYFTVLLVDLSGPIVESQDFPELVNQVGDFIAALKGTHQLTVSLFDGRDDLRTVLEPDETDGSAALARMRRYRPEERKGNLNGAIVKALASLDRQLAASTASHKASNLVVFTDRGDLAQKVPEEELEVALDKTPADVYVIGVGAGIKKPELGKIARTDAFYSTDSKDLGVGFTHLSKHLEVAAAGHYLISYCSPKRKGEHSLEIEVSTEKEEHGLITHKYSADGFTKGCSPKHLPAFAEKAGDKPADDDAQDADNAGSAKAAAKKAPAENAAENTDGDEPAKPRARDKMASHDSEGVTPAAAAADDDAEAKPQGKAQGKQDRKREGKFDKEVKEE